MTVCQRPRDSLWVVHKGPGGGHGKSSRWPAALRLTTRPSMRGRPSGGGGFRCQPEKPPQPEGSLAKSAGEIMWPELPGLGVGARSRWTRCRVLGRLLQRQCQEAPLIVAAAGNNGPKTSSQYAVILPGAGVVLATDINTQKATYTPRRRRTQPCSRHAVGVIPTSAEITYPNRSPEPIWERRSPLPPSPAPTRPEQL